MNHLLALSMMGIFTTTPIDTLPPQKKHEVRIPVYAIHEDNRFILWRKITEYDKRRGFPKGAYWEPVLLN